MTRKHQHAFPVAVSGAAIALMASSAPMTPAGATSPNAEPTTCSVAPTTDIFSSSNAADDHLLNQFWTVYGSGETDVGQPTDPWGANSAWAEWDAMQWAWTDAGDYRETMMEFIRDQIKVNGQNADGDMPDGYVWSWNGREDWPNGNHHFDQMPRYVTAVATYALWTGDQEFIGTMLPRVESVLDDYIVQHMDLESGLAVVTHPENHGGVGSNDSTYFDQLRSGHEDAWINTSMYTALESAVALEELAGNQTKAREYQGYLDDFDEAFTEAFWNGQTGRFGGWRDADGQLHDAGYLHVNLEALARGIGDQRQALEIFDTVDGEAAPIDFGPHLGSTDVYHNVVAPRTNTAPVPDEDWEGWADPAEGRKPYGDVVQNGGTVMWLNYYDVMSRIAYQDADAAYEKFTAMLERTASDSLCLTFGPRLWNDFGESLVQLGTNNPFPESGIAALSWKDGFVGMSVDPQGLTVAPNLPTDLVHAGLGDLNFEGTSFGVDVSRGDVVAELGARTNGEAFTLESEFDQVQVHLAPEGATTVTVSLESQTEAGWDPVVTRIVDVDGPDWLSLMTGQQDAGTYRVVIGPEDSEVTIDDSRAVHRSVTRADVRGQAHNLQAKTSFSSVTLVVPPALRDEHVTVRVEERIGSQRDHRSTQTFDLNGEREVVIGLADQHPGRYSFTLVDQRGEEHRPRVIAADRTIYSVTAPGLDVDERVAAGDSVRIAER